MNRINDVIATPAGGKRVRKPDGSLLAASGERVQKSSFWLRRERDGDVTLSPVRAAAKNEAKAKAANAAEAAADKQ